MEMRQCGRSGLRLSALGIGCWEFGGGEYWGEHSQADANAAVRRAVSLGISYFDTAEVYNEGRSEESLGRALQGVPRDRVVVGTKIAPSNTEPDVLVEHCEASLRRLRTDYVDLYMVHMPITPPAIAHFTKRLVRPSVPDAFSTLLKLQEQGKIRYIGVSNFGVERLNEAMSFGAGIAANQLAYNLLARAIELEILPHCWKVGVGVIGHMTLMQGLLADLYPTLDDVPLWQRRTRHFNPRRAGALCRHGEEGAEEETMQAITAIRAIAARHGMKTAEIAVRWALAGKGITCSLVGCRNAEEVEADATAASEPLAPEIVEELNAATLPLLQKLGPSFDYYEGAHNDRTR
jgi:aryl-alcohol dehydrogenase-like predicted oxidoreductase